MIVQKKVNKLDGKNYILRYNNTTESFYLEETSNFVLPKNIYHDLEHYSNRVLTSFSKLKKNLGAMFSGFKGSGKSLVSKHVCIKSKLPVLIINQAFSGDKFNSFIDSINQEIILFFDEFDKVYKEEEHQENLLTLMDGVYSNKILFMFTVNSTDLNEFFFNRPSRIRYNFKFDRVDNYLLRNITDDLLKNKEYQDDIFKVVQTLGAVGVDLVISLIEEVNILKRPPLEVLENLNIRLESSDYRYSASIKDEYGKMQSLDGVIHRSPLSLTEIRFYKSWEGKGVDYNSPVSKMKISHMGNSISFRDRIGNEIVYTPIINTKGIKNLNRIT